MGAQQEDSHKKDKAQMTLIKGLMRPWENYQQQFKIPKIHWGHPK